MIWLDWLCVIIVDGAFNSSKSLQKKKLFLLICLL